MNLGICPMASSSSGNCFLVRSNRTYILLDAGISSARVKKNLEMMDVQFWEMNGVVLTHEHIDHVRSVSAYCHRSTRQHFFATEGTVAALEEKGKGIPCLLYTSPICQHTLEVRFVHAFESYLSASDYENVLFIHDLSPLSEAAQLSESGDSLLHLVCNVIHLLRSIEFAEAESYSALYLFLRKPHGRQDVALPLLV